MGTAATLGSGALSPATAVDRTPVTFDVLEGAAVEQAIPEWDTCFAAPGNAFPQSPWFSTTVWNRDLARRGHLNLVTGRDAHGELRAVFPLWAARSRLPLLGLSTLQPIGLHAQETSAIVVGVCDRTRATAAVADFVLAEMVPAYDVLHLSAIDPTSCLFAELVAAARRRQLPVLCSAPVPTALIHPAPDGPALLPGPSPRFRRNLLRAWRRVQACGARVECREISWEWQQHADAIARIEQARWGEAQPGSGYALADAGVRHALGAMLGRLDRHFRAHAFAIFIEGELGAYVVAFRAGREVELWASTLAERFRPLCAGLLLWDHCLREMARWPGVERIRFGKGGERYKLDWSDAMYDVCELAVVRAAGLRRRRALARLAHLWPPPA
jgi:hypothetical protein